MIITAETSIKELLDSGLISVRTSNVCVNNQLSKVSDIQKYKEKYDSFLRLRNCGLKSNLELMDVLASIRDIRPNSSLFDSLDPNLQQVFIDEYELFIGNPAESRDLINDFIKLFPSAAELYDKISEPDFSLKASLFDSIKNGATQHQTRLAVVKVVSEITKQLNKRINPGDELLASFSALEAKLKKSIDSDFLSQFCQFVLSEAKRNYLKSEYENLTAHLGGHTLTFSRTSFPAFYDAIPYLEYTTAAFVSKFSGKKKSATDFHLKIIIPFREILKSVIGSKENDETFCISLQFPWLSQESISFTADFQKKYGHYPVFHIISSLCNNSTKREFDIFGLRYGLNTQSGALELIDIAQKYNLSRERVRQILSKFSLKNELQFRREDFLKYLDNDILIFESSSKFKDLSGKENVSISFEAFGRIISEYWPFIYEDKYPIPYLVNKKIASAVDRIFSILTKLEGAQYAEDTTIPYTGIFSKKICENPDLIDIIKFAARALGIQIKGRSFFFSQNHIDVENEAYQLLYETGEPLSAETIHSYLKDKYPNDYRLAFGSLKFKLLSSERIQCVGKTSTYKLSHWRNVFGGSIRDLLRKLLDESSEPLSLDYLTSKVTDFFDTNRKNIHSNLSSSEEFVTFAGSLYGLKDKSYPDEFVPFDVSKTRASFDERFELFKKFVEEFNRIPYASGVEDEESLARWKNNVLKRVLEVTDEQVQALTDFLESKHNLPSSGFEMKFKRKCTEYLDFVNENFELPNFKSNYSLASWYSKNISRYQDFNDNRKLFFENLLNELRGLGFC